MVLRDCQVTAEVRVATKVIGKQDSRDAGKKAADNATKFKYLGARGNK